MSPQQMTPKQIEYVSQFLNFKEIACLGLSHFYKNDRLNYKPRIAAIGALPTLKNIQKANAEHIARFLREWGFLQGGLERWKALADKVIDAQALSACTDFQKLELWDGNIAFDEQRVLACYDAFHDQQGTKIKDSGPTVNPKVLHLACPNYFIPVDSMIREAFGISRDSSGYCSFLKKIRDKLVNDKGFSDVVMALANAFEVSPLYVIDKYLWVVTNNKQAIFGNRAMIAKVAPTLAWW